MATLPLVLTTTSAGATTATTTLLAAPAVTGLLGAAVIIKGIGLGLLLRGDRKKREVASERNAQGTVALAGRRGTATATSGARRSCSGERLSKGAEALVDIWLQSPRKRNKTTCSIM